MKSGALGTLIITSVVAFAAAEPAAQNEAEMKQRDLELRAALEKRLQEVTADPQKLEQALVAGRERTPLCKSCHGTDGNATREGVPNLAGQNAVYIVDQLQRYADGRRQDYWMASLAKTFTTEDKINLAIYYAQQQATPAGGGDPALLARGQQLYQSHCAECHGVDGKSSEGYAKLAGQRPEYTVKMLEEFKSSGGKRFNPWMYSRANMLRSQEDLLAVATYLANLP